MPRKKVPAKKTAGRKILSDDASRARQIAEKAYPNMRAVEVVPGIDEIQVAPDATVPDIEHVQRKYGIEPKRGAAPAKDLHMVVLEPRETSDTRGGRQTKTVVVDDEKVVGASDSAPRRK